MAENQDNAAHDDHKIAVFIDMDNVVLGARDAKFQKFEVGLILDRLVEKGDIVVKRAYADWTNHPQYKRTLHESAIELAFTKPHIDTFALVSGDSDFSPLVSKLRENDKHIIGIGVKNSSSRLLIDNCDEFILYDDLARATSRRRAPVKGTGNLPKVKQEAFALLMETVAALQREGKDVIQGSLVKDTIKRKQPQFNEEYHGYNSFGRLLEDAQRHGLIKLRKDGRSGTWVIDEVLEDAG